jgi:hypothetical protein
VTGLLDDIIHLELLKSILAHERERLRFVRYYRSGAGVLVIVLLGGAIGALGEWLGSIAMALMKAGSETVAILLIVLTAIVVFLLGLCIPLFFERLMSSLLRTLRAEEPE